MEVGSSRFWKRLKHSAGGKLILTISKAVSVNERPIFVLGNQKSGTTIIAALLAEYAGLPATLDLRFPSASRLPAVYDGTIPLSKFVERRAWYFSRGVIKEPGLTFLYPELTALFPQAQFVMIVRDPRDNIRSLLNRLEIPGHLKHVDQDRLEEVGSVWNHIVDGTALGAKGENYIETLAIRWNRAAEIYLCNERFIHLVRYEDFLEDKEGQIAHLARRLGQPQVNDISKETEVQYHPQGNRDIPWSEFFSAQNLARIGRVCEENMSALHYI